MVAMFRTNCPDQFSQPTTTGGLPTGGEIGIGVAALVFVVIMIVVANKLWKHKKAVDDAYREKLFPKDVQLGKLVLHVVFDIRL